MGGCENPSCVGNQCSFMWRRELWEKYDEYFLMAKFTLWSSSILFPIVRIDRTVKKSERFSRNEEVNAHKVQHLLFSGNGHSLTIPLVLCTLGSVFGRSEVPICFLGTTWTWTLAAGRMSVNARKLESCLAGLIAVIRLWIKAQRTS